MAMNISPENERILEEAVKSGRFADKEQALAEALRSLNGTTEPDDGPVLPGDKWRERFREHVANTPSTSATFVDDSREIYEGRDG